MDSGGVSAGVNYPLRGEKHTNWEGGMRVAAFVSGGFVPAALRGTSRDLIVHISDWVSPRGLKPNAFPIRC
jgi:arylsulfatase B